MHMLASLVLLQAPFSDGLSSALSPIVIVVAVVLLVIASLVVFFVNRYKRCPPNQVMVVYGSGGKTDEEGRTIAKDLMRSLPPALHTMLDIGGVKVGDGEIFGLVDDEAQEGSAAVAQYEGNGDSGSHADHAVQREGTGGVATAAGEEDAET